MPPKSKALETDAFTEFLKELSPSTTSKSETSLENLVILYNANVLLRANEYGLAQSLFQRLVPHPHFGYLAKFGLGMCHLKTGRTETGLQLLESTYLTCKKPFVALALSHVLIELGRHSEVEDWLFRFSKDLRHQREFLRSLKDQYISSLKSQLQSKINGTKGDAVYV